MFDGRYIEAVLRLWRQLAVHFGFSSTERSGEALAMNDVVEVLRLAGPIRRGEVRSPPSDGKRIVGIADRKEAITQCTR
jgi:hypothetical protein